MAGGMGPAPLTAQELVAWQQGSGVVLRPWEFRALRNASRAYVHETLEENSEPPWADGVVMADDAVVQERVRRLLDRLAMPKPR